MSLSPKRCVPAEQFFQVYKYEATPEEVKKWKIDTEPHTGVQYIQIVGGDVRWQIRRGNYIVQDFWGNIEVLSEAQYNERFKEV